MRFNQTFRRLGYKMAFRNSGSFEKTKIPQNSPENGNYGYNFSHRIFPKDVYMNLKQSTRKAYQQNLVKIKRINISTTETIKKLPLTSARYLGTVTAEMIKGLVGGIFGKPFKGLINLFDDVTTVIFKEIVFFIGLVGSLGCIAYGCELYVMKFKKNEASDKNLT